MRTLGSTEIGRTIAITSAKNMRSSSVGGVKGYVGGRDAASGGPEAGVEPLPQILAQAVPFAPGREGQGYGVLVGTAGENGSADLKCQIGHCGSER